MANLLATVKQNTLCVLQQGVILFLDFCLEKNNIYMLNFRSVGKIIEKGHLHKGEKPVYWSVVGRSAMAETEVEYEEKTAKRNQAKADQIDLQM